MYYCRKHPMEEFSFEMPGLSLEFSDFVHTFLGYFVKPHTGNEWQTNLHVHNNQIKLQN